MIVDVITVYGLAGAASAGLGLYGMLVNPRPLQKVLAFNLMGGGAFLVFGAVARRAAAPGLGPDPIPHAMVITGLVVSFAATALVVALLLRLHAVVGPADRLSKKAQRPGAADETAARRDRGEGA